LLLSGIITLSRDINVRSTIFRQFIYLLRDIRAHKLYKQLQKYTSGNVLDVGGSDFFLTATKKKLNFKSWVTLEVSEDELHSLQSKISDERVSVIVDNGCDMKSVDSDKFDTILNIQVLEHVYQPEQMVKECARVLKVGGRGIFLIPQTGSIHMVPHFFQNFSRFWIEEVMKENSLKIIQLDALGGVWSTIASRMFLSLFQILRLDGFTHKHATRNISFYILLPFMLLFIILSFPIIMLFSLGDISEEASNHLVVVEKVS
jgi:SAM-dependent methyltransferase